MAVSPEGIPGLLRMETVLVAPEEIAALSEIAEMLGVARRTVQRYMERYDFPEPLGILPGGRRVWRRTDVEAWARETLPLSPGRPGKPGLKARKEGHHG